MTPSMKVTRLAPWFGAATAVAKNVGIEMGTPAWAGVLFSGGCSELPYIRCRAGVANDLHRHVINLARVIKDPERMIRLIDMINATPFHPDVLEAAQLHCQTVETMLGRANAGLFAENMSTRIDGLEWAYNYFVTIWMARGGNAGTDGEFRGALPTRWNANGGGSNVRFRSASESLADWQRELVRWEFECLDVFEMLDRIKDEAGKAIYNDAPWPDAGDGYRHKFTDDKQRTLATRLAGYKNVRVVIRFGDHPLIRELYPASQWTILPQASRDQQNQGVKELLIVNGPSYAGVRHATV